MHSHIPINTLTAPSVVLELIYRLKIRDAMTRNVLTVAPETSLREIQAIMKDSSITGVPVVDGRRLAGIVSMDDIIHALENGAMHERADAHMTRRLIVLEDDMPLSFGISYFDKYSFGRFPVVSQQKELVGIITNRDITNSLIVEMNKELEELEKQVLSQNPILPPDTIHREYIVRKYDYQNAGRVSTEIKKLLKSKQIDRKTVRRISVAAYELEMNQVNHSDGGRMLCSFHDDRVAIQAIDRGPGIDDVDAALQEGFSTANDWIRSLGFGAGMGLPNARRVSDEFTITSEKSTGTTVSVVIYIPEQQAQEE
ncbi:CBS domain-containing protein [Spirochaeta africana]|uniref:Putative transcriptional regulator, contains C-terminal CBS domains n=1 Tax=Spirochaeta africana (strain ATCC 700263 / DSM 8902 / Z-7692) TaxID=889378 RepID=H9ULN9_SPIAZ|nr:CBS domain-containing protein [Spirochaeta africana]AFG38432.1 putative transcriptional regulator, contains C-terminal CBS domains [Spirochaeta africana DSM 8902]